MTASSHNEINQSQTHKRATTEPTTEKQPRTSIWGTMTVFGGGRIALWCSSLAIGCVGGVLIGTIGTFLRNPHQLDDWTFVILMSFLAGGGIFSVAYVLLVDRTTITGNIPNPEENIESQWREKASWASMTGMLLAIAAFIFLVAFYDKPIAPLVVSSGLLAIILVGLLSGLFAYAIVRKRDLS